MKYTQETLDLCTQVMADNHARPRPGWHTLVAQVLDAIPEPPALPEWISVKERLPTEEDGDSEGEVLWRTRSGEVTTQGYDDFSGNQRLAGPDAPESWAHWMPCAPIAALPKRPVPVPDDSDLRKEFAARLPEGDRAMNMNGNFYDAYIEAKFQGYKLAKQ